jgi:hypothetical protein
MRQARRGGRAMELRCRRCAWGVKLGWANCLRISLSHLFAPLLSSQPTPTVSTPVKPCTTAGSDGRRGRRMHAVSEPSPEACRLVSQRGSAIERVCSEVSSDERSRARLPLLRVRGRQSLMRDGASDARLPGLNPPLHILQSIFPQGATDSSPLRFSERV